MYTLLFYYTLCIMLACTLAAATGASAYLVSRNRTFLFAMIMFLFYFFDVALVFQHDFLRNVTAHPQSSFWAIGNPVLSILTGGGTFLFLWLTVCSYLGESRSVIRFAPPLAWVVASAVILLVPFQQMRVHEFWFYTMREVLLFCMYGYLLVRYATCHDDVQRARMYKFRWVLLGAFLLTLGVLVADVYFQLLFKPTDTHGMWFFAERSPLENMLFILFGVVVVRAAFQSLSLRFEHPPARESDSVEASISHTLPYYCKLHGLSERESEVLGLVLQGKDNQNIASTLMLSPSTAKVHVHNILKKTQKKNRQELIQDFWKY